MQKQANKGMIAFPLKYNNEWRKQTGQLRFGLTNDYLFRALMQSEKEVLRSVVAAVLRRKPEEILTVDILNPIIMGESMDDKSYVLDLRVTVNGHELSLIHI